MQASRTVLACMPAKAALTPLGSMPQPSLNLVHLCVSLEGTHSRFLISRRDLSADLLQQSTTAELCYALYAVACCDATKLAAHEQAMQPPNRFADWAWRFNQIQQLDQLKHHSKITCCCNICCQTWHSSNHIFNWWLHHDDAAAGQHNRLDRQPWACLANHQLR